MPNVAQGGSFRLSVVFRDSTNALVDPVSPALEILDPSDTIVASGLALVRDSLGQYHYDHPVAADAVLGTWTGRFTGIIDGSTVAADEEFTVVVPGVASVPGELVTLAEIKAALGIDPTDTRKDAQYSAAISYASKVISNYAERDFGAPLVTETRSFNYNPDDAGILDIDDCASITAVAISVPNGTDLPLDPVEYTPLPARRDDSPVYYYLAIPGLGASLGYSPAMGFTRNLDVYAAEGRLYGTPTTVHVTAQWGWPDVPEDVKMATIWTITDWTSKSGQGENLTSEAIEGYARSWGNKQDAGMALAIPNRARDILVYYQKTYV